MHKTIESLYIHFPFCRHLCNYCDFYKKIPKNMPVDLSHFHMYLENSFKEHKKLTEVHSYSFSPLKSLYIGGGTPSLWGETGSSFLKAFLDKNEIKLDTNCEFTLEVNPGAWTHESINSWQKIGANRFSLGIQSLNKQMIQFLDRVHSIEDVYETLRYFKENKLNFSVDFMLGLSFSQNENRNILNELNEVLQFNPSHFSIYILTVKDNYAHYSNLPSEEYIENEFLQVSEFLQMNNFLHYEVSNFALKDKQSIHNLKYWKSGTVAALGPSATGFLKEVKIRYKWKPNSPILDIETLTDNEFNLEQIYMSLRSEEGLMINQLNEKFQKLIDEWVNRKYGNVTGNKFQLNSKGYLILDSLINELFSNKII